MENLPLAWDGDGGVADLLKDMDGFAASAKKLKTLMWDEEAEVFSFFKVRYDPGEVITPKGAFSDYALLHLKGVIRVSPHEANLTRMPECWKRPRPWMRALRPAWLRNVFYRLLRLVDREDALASPDADSTVPAAARREQLGQLKSIHTWSAVGGKPLPVPFNERVLALTSALWRRPRSVTLLADNDGAERCEVLLIKRKALLEILGLDSPKAKGPHPLYLRAVNEFAQNVLPDVLPHNRLLRGAAGLDFTRFAEVIRREEGDALLPLRVEEGDVVYKAGDPADALYLVLNGRLRASRPGAFAPVVFGHLGENDVFGEKCAVGPEAKREAEIRALTRGVLLKLKRSTVEVLRGAFPAFDGALRAELARVKGRDEKRPTGQLRPPEDVTTQVAARLMRATNLLVIDMDRCTRCDQCVQACTQAHDDLPRFHRSNPALRIGRLEVAEACVHCVDAPCLEECPVGAITFLDSGAVHIHRNRCIGCANCVPACPFHVIDMHLPTKAPGDGISLDPARNKTHVATKCDLCLTKDHEPPCVVACPYGAAIRGKPEELFPDILSWARDAGREGP